MSNWNMFKIAQQLGDDPVKDGLANFRTMLRAENELTKNWQDAETYHQRTDAIRAQASKQAANDFRERDLTLAKNQYEQELARHWFDENGNLRSGRDAAYAAARGGNVLGYAMNNAVNAAKQAAAAEVPHLAAVSPQMAVADWQRFGVLPQGVVPGKDGKGNITFTDPNGNVQTVAAEMGGFFVGNPAGGTQTLTKEYLRNLQAEQSQGHYLDRLDKSHGQALEKAALQNQYNAALQQQRADLNHQNWLKQKEWLLQNAPEGGVGGGVSMRNILEYAARTGQEPAAVAQQVAALYGNANANGGQAVAGNAIDQGAANFMANLDAALGKNEQADNSTAARLAATKQLNGNGDAYAQQQAGRANVRKNPPPKTANADLLKMGETFSGMSRNQVIKAVEMSLGNLQKHLDLPGTRDEFAYRQRLLQWLKSASDADVNRYTGHGNRR